MGESTLAALGSNPPLTNPMFKTRLIHLALLSLLLFMQSAVASHDIDHQYQGHTEACEVFVTADKHSAIESTPIRVEFTPFPANVGSHESRRTDSANLRHYSSRAPPLS